MPYPPSSISNILAGLYRHAKAIMHDFPNFMNRKDQSFRELTGALQVRFRKLREEGVGVVVKHAAVVTEDEEDTLWKSGVIGVDDPSALQRAVFFMLGKSSVKRWAGAERSKGITVLFILVTQSVTRMSKTVLKPGLVKRGCSGLCMP